MESFSLLTVCPAPLRRAAGADLADRIDDLLMWLRVEARSAASRVVIADARRSARSNWRPWGEPGGSSSLRRARHAT
jgi:hypothetical protein